MHLVRVFQIDSPGQQLIYNEPFLYDTAIPENLMATLPSFVEVAKGSHRHQAPWFNAAEFSSKGGVTFNSFAKSKHFGKGKEYLTLT